MDQVLTYIKPELLILIPVCYFIGVGLKNSATVKDKWIPYWLGGCGIVLSTLWVLATSTFCGWQSFLMAAFTAIVQGILSAGCSVYMDQLIKQASKID